MALICHCRLVSDRRIVDEVAAGACTLAEVQARCGAATRCGGCIGAVEVLVAASAVPASAVA